MNELAERLMDIGAENPEISVTIVGTFVLILMSSIAGCCF